MALALVVAVTDAAAEAAGAAAASAPGAAGTGAAAIGLFVADSAAVWRPPRRLRTQPASLLHASGDGGVAGCQAGVQPCDGGPFLP